MESNHTNSPAKPVAFWLSVVSLRRRLRHVLLQIKGRLLFGKKVGILGNFYVADASNVRIGDHCGINEGVFILGHTRIEIGSHVVLSARCMLLDAGLDRSAFAHSDFPKHASAPIVIEDGAWIGAGAIVLAGVTVGRKSIVGAGSVVTKNVPPFTIVAGNPAKRIGGTNE